VSPALSPRPPASVIGRRVNRVEGRAKVTGQGRYAADHHPAGLAYALGVGSPIAAGKLLALHTAAAERAPGVIAVLHRGNFPKLTPSPNNFSDGTKVGEVRLPFADDTIFYAGQWIAVVVAESFAQARAAARLIRADYREDPPELSLGTAQWPERSQLSADAPDLTRGDPDRAWREAPVKVEATYTTPVEVHNVLELHAATAAWDQGKLTVEDSTQWVVGARKALAKILDTPARDITIRAPFVGGGFGGKLFVWGHTIIAAAAARKLGRPVKLVLERKQAFTVVGHRPATRQRLQVGARTDGTLVMLRHDSVMHTSKVDEFVEVCGEATKVMYRCPHLAVTHRLVALNVGTPTPMRGPGAVPGLFALECAMDELAVKLRLDPIELRRRNEARKDPQSGLPWSSKHLEECLDVAARRFGWKQRQAQPGSMRDGSEILGWGFAAATWPGWRMAASARVELRRDGSAKVLCATQDPGTGTYTVVAQIAAEVLGLPVEKIEVAIGDSSHPEGPISGGSMATSTVVPAIAAAARAALDNLRRLAVSRRGPLAGAAAGALIWRDGVLTDRRRRRSAPLAQILASAGLTQVKGEATAGPGAEAKKYSFRSFGAHCVEVRWDPGIARLRVSRVVSAFDVGRIINRQAAENQVHGSIVMGLGMTLQEASLYDPRTGRVVTDNLADYVMPVNADTPAMDVAFVEHPDLRIGEFGARGVGELGMAGVPAAIANAIYHATGRRFRDLPIRIEHLLG